jgi:hypothetical protein
MNTTAATLSNAQIFEEAWRNHDAQVGERCCGCLTTVNMPAATTALKTDDHRSSLQETTDSTGLRAATLQRQIDAAISAGKPATIAISGVYNFSNSSLHLEGCHRLSLVGDGATTTKLLFQGGPRFRTPELPKVLVHGDGGADTFKEGYRLFPNPLVAAGGTYRSGATQQTCQAWCGGNITCKGAVFVAATKRCYSLPTVVSFYPDKGMASWSKVPAQPTDGPPGGGSKWNPSGMLSGVNATNCAQSSIKQLSIDYEPKPKSLFCFAGSNVDTCDEGHLGITLHFFNSSEMTAEDVTIHAAPYMAVTSFNGEGGHVLRRVEFEPNEPGQLFVSERDGVHESDVRRGISILQSKIYGQRDDFLNIHSTLLVVLRCAADRRSCLVVNPHVESGKLDTTYSMNSLLEASRAGDQLSFIPMYSKSDKPARLQRLTGAVLGSAAKVTSPEIATDARLLSKSMLAKFPGTGHPLIAGPFTPDVWNISLASATSVDVPPSTLVNVDSMQSAGAIIQDSVFNFTTGAMRFKSSDAVIRNNSVHNEGCHLDSDRNVICAGASLELSYLQSWYEGAAFISNVTIENNRWYLGAGVNPLKANPIDTSQIVQRGDQFLPKMKTDDAVVSTGAPRH